MVLTALGDKPAAERSHREAIALQPDVARFHVNLGMALPGNDGLACYREALRLDPRSSVAHSNIGVTLYEQGDISGAADSFRAAIALDPDRIDTRSKLLFVSSFDEACSSGAVSRRGRGLRRTRGTPGEAVCRLAVGPGP